MSGNEGRRGFRWGPLLLEFAVIFIGITASFWVEEWREERQDRGTFHRILGEIYYDVILDESQLSGAAVANNLALQHASDLVLRDLEPPPPDELFDRMEIVFSSLWFPATLGGYTRLANTPLAIPVNDVQLDLDYRYGAYLALYDGVAAELEELRTLRGSLWASTGAVACAPPLTAGGWSGLTPGQIEELDLRGQMAPAYLALRELDRCLTDPFNRVVVARVLDDEEFRVGLRRVIGIRENLAWALVNLRVQAVAIRRLLEAYFPEISLPIETLGLVGSATPGGWEPADAVGMRRVGANDWVQETRLADGELKFAANGEWTMNWGVARPWVGGASAWSFEARQFPPDEVFPSGTARFNGLNIPVEAGRWRVRFNAQSGAYSFERLAE
ncbi:MAG: hypothetical protein R6X22_02100 [Gemmatimonadota bacterium]